MDVGTLIRILVKRWYVVVPVLAITLAAAYQVGTSMRPAYQARGAVLLIGPNTIGDIAVNPLAELRSPLNTTALAISFIAGDEQTRTELELLGFEGVYSVTAIPDTPILDITVRAETPEQALLTLEAVIQAVQLELDERQRGVQAPPNSLIEGEVLTRTTTSRALYGSRDRAVAVITGLGLMGAAAAAILTNSYALRRAQTAAAWRATTAAGTDGDGDGDGDGDVSPTTPGADAATSTATREKRARSTPDDRARWRGWVGRKNAPRSSEISRGEVEVEVEPDGEGPVAERDRPGSNGFGPPPVPVADAESTDAGGVVESR